jgi:hypothetical protein
MNFRNRCNAIITVLTVALINNAATPTPASADVITNKAFRIAHVDNQSLVVDAYGDNLPQTKTFTHFYSATGAVKTAQMTALFQPWNNNSYEIHMQNDNGLCFGPDVTSRNQLRDGVAAVVKRDCANTLNHVLEGEYLRVNNTNFCLDTPRGNVVQGQKLHYWTCNRSTAQRFKVIDPSPNGLKSIDGACYRRPNRGIITYSCDYAIPPGATSINWTGGAYATLILSRAPITQKNGFDTPGKSFNRYLNPDEGTILLPAGIESYRIAPWNEGQTTRFSFTVPQ